jgi:hypothetical protein
MSFPYTLDLSFGSEKATADSFGRVSFGASGGDEGTKIPTNVDELNALVESGKAVNIETQFASKITGQHVWPSSEDPNILGFVSVLQDVVTSLPVVYSTEVEESGYCFTEAHQGNIGESDLYVIYK